MSAHLSFHPRYIWLSPVHFSHLLHPLQLHVALNNPRNRSSNKLIYFLHPCIVIFSLATIPITFARSNCFVNPMLEHSAYDREGKNAIDKWYCVIYERKYTFVTKDDNTLKWIWTKKDHKCQAMKKKDLAITLYRNDALSRNFKELKNILKHIDVSPNEFCAVLREKCFCFLATNLY